MLVDAHPLVRHFAEGDPDEPSPEDVGPPRLIPIGGGRLPIVNTRPTPAPPIADVPGVTWDCFSDLDTGNGTTTDCVGHWAIPGGDYHEATVPPALVAGPAGTMVGFDVTADVIAGVSSWLLRLHDEASADALLFYSEEGAVRIGDPEVGPVLVLE